MKRYLESFLNRESLAQLVKVAVIGIGNTAVSFLLFNVFLIAIGWSWFWAVAGAFGLTTFMSYLLNRRWTFQLTDGKVSGRETAQFYAINFFAWMLTELTLWVADVLVGPLSDLQANVAYLVASVLILVPKFASYRDIVFGKAVQDQSEAVPLPNAD